MIAALRSIRDEGWIRSIRPLNAGGIGNTIETKLGFGETNLPIADTAQWELKTHRIGSTSLITFFHKEPEPRQEKIVAASLLPNYGWPDQTRDNEMSFRQTLRATGATDRGFTIVVDRQSQRLRVTFDSGLIDRRHHAWMLTVLQRAGLGPLMPEPYWDLQQLFLTASTKMLNAFYVEAEARRLRGDEFFAIRRVSVLQNFDIDRFLDALEEGDVLVDFDARTHHNHGTKFRLRQTRVPGLYRYVDVVLA
ncbi:MAG: MvaI/BcnI restriction endonuclease family protein [Chloroflexi bacterium]|nr:MvaI/BcnI restriction endonuclease family protein [Chloroflexota bacterium]